MEQKNELDSCSKTSAADKRIMCECGEKILLVPNVKEMDIAIESHANKHALRENCPEEAQAVFDKIQKELVQKTLRQVSMKF